jgi:hypothetical protein
VGLFDKRLWVKVERRWGLGRATSLKFTTREEKNKEETIEVYIRFRHGIQFYIVWLVV